jgi:bifunctional NMN adenylyltransferase/nudix hydrolase
MTQTQKDYDHLVFIGRFQPFHNGHKHVIDTALSMSKHVIILIGSSNSSRNSRNPFTFEERKQMILDAYQGTPYNQVKNLEILPIEDYTYNDGEWTRAVSRTVNGFLRSTYPSTTYEDIARISEKKVGLIGHSKDSSSYYLKLFPTWGNIDVSGVEGGKHKLINATDIRALYFSPQWHDMSWTKLVPEPVAITLLEWLKTEDYANVMQEHKFVLEYKKQWELAPYAPTFVTTDAVVVQAGHVLLVRRGAQPGKGKLALPGGFLDQSETLLDGAIRELREETKLKVPEAVLRGSIKNQRTFDDPHRSARGRTITTAFLIQLPLVTELPKVKGSDDAEEAMWVPLSELKAEDLFEDHFFIIQNLTAIL